VQTCYNTANLVVSAQGAAREAEESLKNPGWRTTLIINLKSTFIPLLVETQLSGGKL